MTNQDTELIKNIKSMISLIAVVLASSSIFLNTKVLSPSQCVDSGSVCSGQCQSFDEVTGQFGYFSRSNQGYYKVMCRLITIVNVGWAWASCLPRILFTFWNIWLIKMAKAVSEVNVNLAFFVCRSTIAIIVWWLKYRKTNMYINSETMSVSATRTNAFSSVFGFSAMY